MNKYELYGLKNLLELWKKEYPLTVEHKEIVDKLIYWISNILHGLKN